MTRADLIDALERAEGPSRELDAEIERLFLPDTFMGRRVERWHADGSHFWCDTDDGFRHFAAHAIRGFTHSLDAAVTLVPAGYGWSVDSLGCAWVGPAGEMEDGWCGTVTGQPPALALCIAALKAREAGDE